MTSTREKKSVRNHCGRVGEKKVRGMVGMKVRDREEKRKKVRNQCGGVNPFQCSNDFLSLPSLSPRMLTRRTSFVPWSLPLFPDLLLSSLFKSVSGDYTESDGTPRQKTMWTSAVVAGKKSSYWTPRALVLGSRCKSENSSDRANPWGRGRRGRGVPDASQGNPIAGLKLTFSVLLVEGRGAIT